MPGPMGDIELLDWAKGEAWPRIGQAVRRVIEERDRMAAHVIRLTKELQEARKGKEDKPEVLVGFASDGSVVEVPPASAPTVHDEDAVKFDGSTGRRSENAGHKGEGSGV